MAKAANTVTVVRIAANSASAVSAIRPARAAATVWTIPITSSAATSGTIVICSARSHSVPTTSAAGSTHPAAVAALERDAEAQTRRQAAQRPFHRHAQVRDEAGGLCPFALGHRKCFMNRRLRLQA